LTAEEIIEDGGCKNCTNCITLYNHPWNKTFKGSILTKSGIYACILRHDIDNNREGVLMERDGVGCEMFEHIKQKEINDSKKGIKKYNL